MKMKWIGASLILVMMAASPLFADSVYSWTDEDGVRHYSNTGIPPGVQDADERPEEISSSPVPESGQSSGEEGNRANPAGPDSVDTPEEEAAASEGKQQMDRRLAARVEKERQRLEAEIKRIKGLSIGKSFTPGMKDAMVKPVEEQLALLNADPERYFRMKQEGAFSNSSGGSAPTPSGPLSNSLESFERSSSSASSTEGEGNAPEENSPPPASE